MTTTTSYGTWCPAVDQYATTVEDTVIKVFSGEGPDGFDLDAIVADYRQAINDALPSGVSLHGNLFIGPYHPADQHFDGYPLNEDGQLDIRAIVNGVDGVGGVDLWQIINRHANVAATCDKSMLFKGGDALPPCLREATHDVVAKDGDRVVTTAVCSVCAGMLRMKRSLVELLITPREGVLNARRGRRRTRYPRA